MSKPWKQDKMMEWNSDTDQEEEVGTGWINDAEGKFVVRYEGCGSHVAEWAPGALERVLNLPVTEAALRAATLRAEQLERELQGMKRMLAIIIYDYCDGLVQIPEHDLTKLDFVLTVGETLDHQTQIQVAMTPATAQKEMQHDQKNPPDETL